MLLNPCRKCLVKPKCKKISLYCENLKKYEYTHSEIVPRVGMLMITMSGLWLIGIILYFIFKPLIIF